jgi:RNA polymerase-binding transcription factor
MTDTRWTQEELTASKERLLNRLAELRNDIQRELRKSEDEQYSGLADRVADLGEQSVADLLVDVDLAEITRDVAELRDLEQGLSRLARGVYGLCVDCEMPIDAARLYYSPGAARCVPCQERLESQGGRKDHSTL